MTFRSHARKRPGSETNCETTMSVSWKLKKKITQFTNVLKVRHGASVLHIPWLDASWDTAFSFRD